jgi:hypothetical protein
MALFQTIFTFLLAPLALAQGADSAMPTKSPEKLTCEIRSVPVAGGVRLEAVALAAPGASGEYELLVAKTGGGGTSNVTQGGEFTVGPQQEVLLGEVTLGGGNNSVKAHLTVNWADGSAECEARFPRRL